MLTGDFSGEFRIGDFSGEFRIGEFRIGDSGDSIHE